MAGSTLIASIRYRNALAAIEWLETVFGFHRHVLYHGPENTVSHAELTLGDGMVLLGSTANASPYGQHLAHPDEVNGRVTSVFYVVAPDCAALYERAREQGATVLQELAEVSYGGKAFTVVDPEGYAWAAGEYNPWTAGEVSSVAEENSSV